MAEKTNDLDHEFDTYLEHVSCFNVMSFKYEDRCNFLHKVPDCNDSDSYIPVMVDILECKLEARSRFAEWILILVSFILAIYLVLIIATVADTFFCPALKVVSKLMHMSEHLAGSTVVAFGNSADEFFSHVCNIGKGDQIVTNCMSKSCFIVMVAGGMVCFFRPFKLQAYQMIRDMLFFLAGLLIIDTTSHDNRVTLPESFSIISFYMIFVIVSIIDICLENRELRKEDGIMAKKKSVFIAKRRQTSMVDFVHRPSSISTLKNAKGSVFTTRMTPTVEYVDLEATKTAVYSADHPKNFHLFRDFINSINPFYETNWSESSFIKKVYIVLLAPINLVTHIYLPIVDVESDRHGWSKLLNCVQIILLTPISLTLTGNTEYFYYMWFSFIITIPIAIFVIYHARTDLPPFYHKIFAFLTCVGSLCFVYLISNLIDDVLGVFGSFLGLSKDFCGATIWGWGFAIGDVVSNTVLAFHGYENMAFAACIGGPFFTLMICIGIVFVAESWDQGTAYIEHGLYSENAFVFLTLGLLATLLWASLLNFHARRCVGVFNLGLYLVFITFAILTEKEVIHTFKYDPQIELK